MAGLMVKVSNPLGKLSGVGNCGRQEHVVNVVREQDDGLLPHNPTLLVSHVVDLVEYDPAHLPHDLAAAVQHGPQDLCGHDEAGCARIDCDVTGHETNVGELLVELSVLLVAEGLDWGGVDDALLVLERERYGIFRHYSLTGGRVCGD